MNRTPTLEPSTAPGREPAGPDAVDETTLTKPAEYVDAPAWLLMVGGLIGLAASLVLLVEKVELLKNPDYVPSCNISPLLSCGSIMRTTQSEAFGFPNPILGVIGFAVVATVGASLLAGAQYGLGFWLGLQAGTTLGAAFVHWLIFQSLYRIDALCPYCMVVWVVTMAIFLHVTLATLRRMNPDLVGVFGRIVDISAEFHGVILTAWVLLVAGLITLRFWDYWLTLLR